MTRIDEVNAILRRRRQNGHWTAYASDGTYYVVPFEFLQGESGISARSGVKILISLVAPIHRGQVAIRAMRNPDTMRLTPSGKRLQKRQLGEGSRETRILIVGRTGVGKSSTINSVVGAPVAGIGHFRPTTSELHFY